MNEKEYQTMLGEAVNYIREFTLKASIDKKYPIELFVNALMLSTVRIALTYDCPEEHLKAILEDAIELSKEADKLAKELQGQYSVTSQDIKH